MNLDDTIVAVSSSPGAAVRGIVRLSGPDARAVADQIFFSSGPSLKDVSESRYLAGDLQVAGGRLPASAYAFIAPKTYTRQDIVELHMLGSPGVLSLLVEQCLDLGVRRAEPGEFTARAFLAGAFDLSQVHGIAGMVAARSDLQLQAASRLLHGALSRTALTAREELADLLSLVEGAMDFADEPIEFIAPVELRRRLAAIRQTLQSTAAAGLRAERWGELPRILLSGPPNAGKSSLLNRLTGLNRAICAPIAGTTRDVLTAPLALEGIDCLLMDVAGIEEAAIGLQAAAQSAARTAVENADLVLQVFDASALQEAQRFLPSGVASSVIVGNKCDLLDGASQDRIRKEYRRQDAPAFCLVSAATGEGCDSLKAIIARALRDRPVDINDAAIALIAEHRHALEDALDGLDRAIDLADQSGDSLADADLVAAELHVVAEALARLVGRDDTEDLLGRIFSRFCVGK